jgi:hypothetical protein
LLLKLGAFLMLGAIVNVAVAWASALKPPPLNFTNIHNQTASSVRKLPQEPADAFWPTHWMVKQHQSFAGVRTVVTVISLPGKSTEDDFQRLLPQVDGFREKLVDRELKPMTVDDWCGFFVWDARGWPMLSLTCHWPWWHNPDWPKPSIKFGVNVGVPTQASAWPFGVFELRALPFCPLWPGSAINTIFYGAILWLLWITPGKVRRFVRIRQGRCPSCGYQIAEGVGPRCSECGAARH